MLRRITKTIGAEVDEFKLAVIEHLTGENLRNARRHGSGVSMLHVGLIACFIISVIGTATKTAL